jgi:hypothetical protein
MKDGKNQKVLDRGVTFMFVEYNNNHSGICYRMYNPVTSKVVSTCNAIWLWRMFYTRLPHKLDHKKMAFVSVPINMIARKIKDELEMLEVVTQTSVPVSEEREGTVTDSLEKSCEWVTTKMGFRCEVGRKLGVYNPATGSMVK